MDKLSGWQRLTVILVSIWMLSVLGLSTYEYATSKDGTFTGLVFPLKSIILHTDETKPRATGQGREPEIATERVVHWRILVGALTFPFAILLGVSLLSRLLSWVVRGFSKSSN